MRTSPLLLLTAALPLYALSAGSKDAPSWVQEASSRQLPAYSGEVPAVVLLDERHVTVDASGAFTISSRRAIKVLTREGAKEADAAEFYSRKGVKVNHLSAWLIAPNGFTKSYEIGRASCRERV